jgi:multicomponent Na+:H+ antiporter subunit C
METILALVVGALFAAGLYTILRRSIVRLAIGLVLIGHAANLLIFTAAGLRRDAPPILPDDAAKEGPVDVATAAAASLQVADPLPQALVLTAIVIGFGVLAYTLVLVHRVYRVVGSDDVESLTATDQLPEDDAGHEPTATDRPGGQR